ncbi:hypothetical protein [Nonomuraea roseola]|uniref:Uncharacterized protein n=1 Tax=Nonomuraea roseola TaxID=46179 RepID=A0ABV5QBF7_9ACTN
MPVRIEYFGTGARARYTRSTPSSPRAVAIHALGELDLARGGSGRAACITEVIDNQAEVAELAGGLTQGPSPVS